MVRSSQLLHTQREPVPPRPAATVLLLRDAQGRRRSADDAPFAHRQFRAGRLRLSRRRHRCCRCTGPRHRRPPARPGRPAPDPSHCRHPRKLRRTGRPAGPPCGWPGCRCAGRRGIGPRSAADRAVPRPGPGTGRRPGVRVRPLDHRSRPAAALRRAVPGSAHARGPKPGGRRNRAVRAGLGAARRRPGAPRGRQLLHDLPDHPHAGAAGQIRLGASGAPGLRRRPAAVDQLPAGRPAQGRRCALHGA